MFPYLSKERFIAFDPFSINAAILLHFYRWMMHTLSSIKISYTYREANNIAEWIASYITNYIGSMSWDSSIYLCSNFLLIYFQIFVDIFTPPFCPLGNHSTYLTCYGTQKESVNIRSGEK